MKNAIAKPPEGNDGCHFAISKANATIAVTIKTISTVLK